MFQKKYIPSLWPIISTPLTKDPTDKFQKEISEIIKECNLIIDKRPIKFLTQTKAPTPINKAQLQLHKTGIPVRPGGLS
jgi:hypothetical protein